jgi:hypothetical protein
MRIEGSDGPVIGRAIAVGSDAEASAVVRLTATQAQDAGFATVSSCDGPVPPTSNLNFRRDEDISNLAIVELGTSRTVCVDTSAPTQLILDLVAAVR